MPGHRSAHRLSKSKGRKRTTLASAANSAALDPVKQSLGLPKQSPSPRWLEGYGWKNCSHPSLGERGRRTVPGELVWAHSQVQGIIQSQTTAARGQIGKRGPAGGRVPQRRTERLRGRRALRSISAGNPQPDHDRSLSSPS